MRSVRYKYTGRAIILIGVIARFFVSLTSAHASVGDVLADFPFRSADLLADPHQPYVYASIVATKSIAVINTQTLTVQHSISLPGSPSSISLSPDGNSLYVADTGNKSIDVIDTHTMTLSRSIPVVNSPNAVAAGMNNTLYVLNSYPTASVRLEQFDAISGVQVGSSLTVPVNGNLMISPDLETLYFNHYALSPSSLYRYDVSTTTIRNLQHISIGENGGKGILSHDGTFIAQPRGFPYSIGLYHSDDLTSIGTLPTGAYPNAVALSPDDSIAYVSHAPSAAVEIYNTSTFEKLGHFSIPERSFTMTTDNTGQMLFIAFNESGTSHTIAYRVVAVPEPSTIMLTVAVFATFATRRRRSTSHNRV